MTTTVRYRTTVRELLGGDPTPPHRRAVRHRLRRSRRHWWLYALSAVCLLTSVTVIALAAARDRPVRATLRLTVAEIAVGDSYHATATGLDPGEPVRLSWLGPTVGRLGVRAAEADGTVRYGPVVELDPPGSYLIVADGQTSGRTASAPLRVLPGP